MATIPPWINVSPSDFLQAMQAGAMAGLQVSNLRRSARADADRLAFAAAESEAARADAAARSAAALDFQRWEQEQRSRQAAAEFEAGLKSQLELAQQATAQQHYKTMEEAAKGRLEAPLSPVGRLQMDYDRAVKSGNTEAAEQLKAAIEQSISNKGRSIYMGTDAEGKPIFEMTEGGAPSRAGALGKATTAMTTQAQQKLAQYENSAELLNWLQRKLRPEHVGAAGVVGELVLDKVLPQLGAQTANRGRVDVRTALTTAREGLMREISGDPRFSNVDRQEIAKALPSSGVFESYDDAQQRIATVRRILANRGKVYAQTLGIKPPGWAMPIQEIIQRYQDGLKSGLDPQSEEFKNQFFTREEAVTAMERFY